MGYNGALRSTVAYANRQQGLLEKGIDLGNGSGGWNPHHFYWCCPAHLNVTMGNPAKMQKVEPPGNRSDVLPQLLQVNGGLQKSREKGGGGGQTQVLVLNSEATEQQQELRMFRKDHLARFLGIPKRQTSAMKSSKKKVSSPKKSSANFNGEQSRHPRSREGGGRRLLYYPPGQGYRTTNDIHLPPLRTQLHEPALYSLSLLVPRYEGYLPERYEDYKVR